MSEEWDVQSYIEENLTGGEQSTASADQSTAPAEPYTPPGSNWDINDWINSQGAKDITPGYTAPGALVARNEAMRPGAYAASAEDYGIRYPGYKAPIEPTPTPNKPLFDLGDLASRAGDFLGGVAGRAGDWLSEQNKAVEAQQKIPRQDIGQAAGAGLGLAQQVGDYVGGVPLYLSPLSQTAGQPLTIKDVAQGVGDIAQGVFPRVIGYAQQQEEMYPATTQYRQALVSPGMYTPQQREQLRQASEKELAARPESLQQSIEMLKSAPTVYGEKTPLAVQFALGFIDPINKLIPDINLIKGAVTGKEIEQATKAVGPLSKEAMLSEEGALGKFKSLILTPESRASELAQNAQTNVIREVNDPARSVTDAADTLKNYAGAIEQGAVKGSADARRAAQFLGDYKALPGEVGKITEAYTNASSIIAKGGQIAEDELSKMPQGLQEAVKTIQAGGLAPQAAKEMLDQAAKDQLIHTSEYGIKYSAKEFFDLKPPAPAIQVAQDALRLTKAAESLAYIGWNPFNALKFALSTRFNTIVEGFSPFARASEIDAIHKGIGMTSAARESLQGIQRTIMGRTTGGMLGAVTAGTSDSILGRLARGVSNIGDKYSLLKFHQNTWQASRDISSAGAIQRAIQNNAPKVVDDILASPKGRELATRLSVIDPQIAQDLRAATEAHILNPKNLADWWDTYNAGKRVPFVDGLYDRLAEGMNARLAGRGEPPMGAGLNQDTFRAFMEWGDKNAFNQAISRAASRAANPQEFKTALDGEFAKLLTQYADHVKKFETPVVSEVAQKQAATQAAKVGTRHNFMEEAPTRAATVPARAAHPLTATGASTAFDTLTRFGFDNDHAAQLIQQGKAADALKQLAASVSARNPRAAALGEIEDALRSLGEQVPERAATIDDVRRMALSKGIATAGATGAPTDAHLLNVLNKHIQSGELPFGEMPLFTRENLPTRADEAAKILRGYAPGEAAKAATEPLLAARALPEQSFAQIERKLTALKNAGAPQSEITALTNQYRAASKAQGISAAKPTMDDALARLTEAAKPAASEAAIAANRAGEIAKANARWAGDLAPLLSELAQQEFAKGAPRIPEQLAKEVSQFLRGPELSNGVKDLKSAAGIMGKWSANMTGVNYGARTKLDPLIDIWMPFSMFPTRTLANTAIRMIDRPGYAAFYLESLKRLDEMQSDPKQFPPSLRGKIELPMPFLPSYLGKSAFVDPSAVFFPGAEVVKRYQDAFRYAGVNDNDVANAIRAMAQNDPKMRREAELALSTKRGSLWDSVKQDLTQSRGAGIGSLDELFKPHTPIDIAMKMLSGRKDEIGNILPITNFIRSMTGKNIEAPLRGALGLPAFSIFDQHNIEKQLMQMVADGQIKARDAEIAAQEHKGPAWDAAEKRFYESQRPNYLTSLLGFPSKVFPQGEQTYYAARSQRDQLWDSEVTRLGGKPDQMSTEEKLQFLKDNGGFKAGGDLQKFYDAHPELSVNSFMYKTQEGRLKDFLQSEIWNQYNDMPALDKRMAAQQLGDAFKKDFLDTKTRDYSNISNDQLARWATFFKGYVPQTETTTLPSFAQGALPAYVAAKPEWVAAYDERNKQVENLGGWDRINLLESTYFNYPERSQQRRDYLAANPDLKIWFNYSAKWRADNADLAKALGLTAATQQAAGQPSGPVTSSRPGGPDRNTPRASFTPTFRRISTPPRGDFSQFSDPYVRQALTAYFYGGVVLPDSARAKLMQEWQSRSGTTQGFDAWLATLRPRGARQNFIPRPASSFGRGRTTVFGRGGGRLLRTRTLNI